MPARWFPPRRRAPAGAERRRSIRDWQDRIRDPSLTVLLVLELCLAFLAAPLAAKGVPVARAIGETMVLVVLALVVMLSHRRGAIMVILLGLAATAAGTVLSGKWSPVAASVLHRGGTILTFSALTWVVSHA